MIFEKSICKEALIPVKMHQIKQERNEETVFTEAFTNSDSCDLLTACSVSFALKDSEHCISAATETKSLRLFKAEVVTRLNAGLTTPYFLFVLQVRKFFAKARF